MLAPQKAPQTKAGRLTEPQMGPRRRVTLAWMPAPQKAPLMKTGRLTEPRMGPRRKVTLLKALLRGPQTTRRHLSGLDRPQAPSSALCMHAVTREPLRWPEPCWCWRAQVRPVQWCTTKEMRSCMPGVNVLYMSCLPCWAQTPISLKGRTGRVHASICLLHLEHVLAGLACMQPSRVWQQHIVTNEHVTAAYLACLTRIITHLSSTQVASGHFLSFTCGCNVHLALAVAHVTVM